VAEDVRRDFASREFGVNHSGSVNRELQSPRDVGAAQFRAGSVRKQRAGSRMRLFAQPVAQLRCSGGPERDRAFFTALATQAHGRAAREVKIVHLNADDLRDPRACVVERSKQHAISSTYPRGHIRCRDDGFDMLPAEKADLPPIETLHRNTHYTVSQCQCCGFLETHVLEERSDRCESGVASSDGVLAVPLEVIKKSQDKLSGQIFDRQIRRSPPELRFRKRQKEAESIAIGADRAGAGLALLLKPFDEELLQEWCERGAVRPVHATPPAASGSRRRAARATRRGVAVTYQYVSVGLAWPM
jgi:hypothetical protein